MKKIAKLALSFVLCFMMALTFSACKEPEIESASIKEGTLETTINQYDVLDTSNVVVIVKYVDGKLKEVESKNLEFGTIDTNTVGEKTLEITYKKYSFEVTIEVVEATVESLEVKSGLVATVGQYDVYSLGNIVVEATFENGAKRTIANSNLSFTLNTEVVGEQTLTISYKGVSTTQTVTVIEAVVASATIKAGTVESSVLVGTELNTNNIVLVVTFENGAVREFSSEDLTIQKPNTEVVTNNAELKVTYKGYTATKTIAVLDAVATDLEIKSEIPAEITQFDTLDLTNLEIEATLSNGKTETIGYEDVEIAPYNTEEAGTLTLTITYKGKTITKDIVVNEAQVKEIKIISGLETEINQYETLDTTQIVAKVVYENNVEKDVLLSDLEIGTIDTTISGEQTLTIKFNGYTEEITINVVKVEITSVIIEGLTETIVKNTNIDLSTMEITINFNSGKTVVAYVGEDELLSVSEIDTTTVGEKEIIVTYNNELYSIFVEVIEEDELKQVASLESKLLTDYKANIQEKENKQIEFVDRTEPIYVGDDNEFNLRIEALDENLEDIKYFGNEVIVELEEVDPQDETKTIFTKLENEELENMVTVGRYATFDFKENAVGKNFRLTISAKLVATGFEDFTTVVANVSVIDGFNVYTAKELSIYDNTNAGWDSIKTEIGVKDLNVKAIILQNDILVTKDDVRSDLFWTKDTTGYAVAQAKTDQVLEGTPIDGSETGIYHREVKSGSEFNFIGNYFSVDMSTFPKMVVEHNGQESGHKGVKATEGEEQIMTGHLATFITTNENVSAETQVNWKNLYFVGNGALTANPIDSGAILLMKNKYVNFNSYNTLTHNFYITYFFELGEEDNSFDGEFIVDSAKAYNSYQTLLYAWGAEHLIIKNSEFKNAGGPAIITRNKFGYY